MYHEWLLIFCRWTKWTFYYPKIATDLTYVYIVNKFLYTRIIRCATIKKYGTRGRVMDNYLGLSNFKELNSEELLESGGIAPLIVAGLWIAGGVGGAGVAGFAIGATAGYIANKK